MPAQLRGLINVLGRIALALIFLMSAVGNKIPNFSGVAGYMKSEGVPFPEFLLSGAIVFLLAGSLSLIVGYQARIGAALLLVFLALATYYFHDFWNVPQDRVQAETIQFMKNLSMMGGMLMVIANGPGPWSVDERK